MQDYYRLYWHRSGCSWIDEPTKCHILILQRNELFQVIISVAPNAVIAYVSYLYSGSISDKAVVQQSGLVNHFSAGDMILADKGFLIQDILPNGVSVNIPPFLNSGTFTESEARATKAVAKCWIHAERANARLKDSRILFHLICTVMLTFFCNCVLHLSICSFL